ncbi:NAD(P)H-hydrate dehydratase [Abyssalbus ytuae]|uniref:Bifunctional NAD(P)H-hydrate repair enzyme n=1 Tax=Abyssalbus ytuae TaxID=2926907 RepID=A0A9E6ZSW0_9FLAO|nr:NAD(P)H-hydrate dehydratase [Abyssalbus ytuae]UOB17233.1 NAD(P)H-hydrate dehydratase [Abyssalbus ytuae]
MKILSREQVYEADKVTAQNQNISSDELMERAGTGVFNWIHSNLQGNHVKIHIFCGIGNNGGDGMVIARHLKNHGYNIQTYVVNFSDKRSKDFLLNLNRLKELKHWPQFINNEEDIPEISEGDMVVDAIFGIGLHRPPAEWVGEIIKQINESGSFVLSIDIPSGLYMDKIPEQIDYIIKANHTLSFQNPKLPFFLPQTGIYCNSWELIDIGIDEQFMEKVKTEAEFITKQNILSLYIPRNKFSHKGTYGHSLIAGGSYGKIGAVVLSSKACLKVGAGLVTSFIPKCGYDILQTVFPECMVITDEDEKIITDIQYDFKPSVIGIGTGMGKDKKTVQAMNNLLSNINMPIVIDADGLNILSENKEMLDKLPENSVLTPHPKELERLIGKWRDDFEKLEKVKLFSKKYNCVVVIKGAHTITVYKDKLYINSTGNPGMASAGSGDVLTGIITGLISQGYTPLNATIFGVYLHGKAADLAVGKTGYEALTATSIIDHISTFYINLFSEDEKKN